MPLGSIRPYSNYLIVSSEPSASYAVVPIMDAAFLVTITLILLISKSIWSITCKVTKHVIILVSDAICLFTLDPFSKSTDFDISS